jgi:hypothetical protein
MLTLRMAIGHASDVVGYSAGLVGLLCVAGGQVARLGAVGSKQIAHYALRLYRGLHHLRVAV